MESKTQLLTTCQNFMQNQKAITAQYEIILVHFALPSNVLLYMLDVEGVELSYTDLSSNSWHTFHYFEYEINCLFV